MIVKPKVSWLRMLFSIRGTSLRVTWLRLLLFTLSSVIVTWFEQRFGLVDEYSLTAEPFTMIGLALGIFLGFRNNAAYDRWWEGRRLWGRLVNTSRSFTRQVLTLIAPEEASAPGELRAVQEQLVRRTIAYVHAVRHHLRLTDPFAQLSQYLQEREVALLREHDNVPTAILQQTAVMLREAWDRGWVSEFHLPVLEASLTDLTDIQGGCERIKTTPIPYAYTVLIHRLVAFYCFFMPFGIVKTVGSMTPVVTLLISYAFFGLDEIGDEIEDPFDADQHALPLEAISRTIEIDLLQAIGAQHVPKPLRPVDDLLL